MHVVEPEGIWLERADIDSLRPILALGAAAVATIKVGLADCRLRHRGDGALSAFSSIMRLVSSMVEAAGINRREFLVGLPPSGRLAY